MKKIVVVEDNDLLRENICEILESEGYLAFPAINGKEGLNTINSQEPDLIISDVNMPVMDGLVLLKTLRSSEKHRAIPFIFLTVRNSMAELRLGMNQGADDYLAKPFDMHQLLSSVNTRLRRSEQSSGISYSEKFQNHAIVEKMAFNEFIKTPLEKN